MDETLIQWWFSAYFTVGMFAAALNAKALGVCIVYALSLVAMYPDVEKATFATLFLIPAVLVANFRD